jgi:hypothetical protein
VVMTTNGSIDPSPDPSEGKRPAGSGKPKVVRKVQPRQFANPAKQTGAGAGRIMRGGRRGR